MYIKRKIDGKKYVLVAPNVEEWKDFKDEFCELVEQPTLEMWMTLTIDFTEMVQEKIKTGGVLTDAENEKIKKLESEAETHNERFLRLIIKKPKDFDPKKISIPAQTELLAIGRDMVSGLPIDKKKA